jgi:hypothetical protein
MVLQSIRQEHSLLRVMPGLLPDGGWVGAIWGAYLGLRRLAGCLVRKQDSCQAIRSKTRILCLCVGGGKVDTHRRRA